MVFKSVRVIFILSTLFFHCSFSRATPDEKKKSIVLIAGEKSHHAGVHEYIKTVRLLKAMLDHSNVTNQVNTTIYLHGWPPSAQALDSADLILFISDGKDGDLYSEVPFMTEERIKVMEKQMNRGCGFSLLHFSTFASNHYGRYLLDWGGGYFDWQDDDGSRKWYSAINTITAGIQKDNSTPVWNGVNPFRVTDEFYYNIRFRENDNRVKPLVVVPELKSNQPDGNVVAWTIERKDGGRGFSTTMGHYYNNWQNPDFRKLLLNAIVWAAGLEVPATGVTAGFYTDKEVIKLIYGKSKSALILTGNNHPAHPWQKTSAAIESAIELDPSFHVDISTSIEDLMQYDLKAYDLLVMNYCNWEDSTVLSRPSKDSFTNYLTQGGGLMIIHFANGAFHYSLPGAKNSDWPEYRKICRFVWDHSGGSAHDPYGSFTVKKTGIKSPVTNGISDFTITDELYYNQKGDEPAEPLLVARSKVTGRDEPLAWVYRYGKGRIFQTVLGHDEKACQNPMFKKLLMNAAEWVSDPH